MIDLLHPDQRPVKRDPYNSVDTPPASDVIEWDDSTVENVVLETPPDNVLPFPGEHAGQGKL